MLSEKMCPLCGVNCYSVPYNDGSAYEIQCSICGKYSVSQVAMRHLKEREELQDYKVMISCLLKENELKGLGEITILFAPNETLGFTIQQLIELFPKSFAERSDRVLQNLSRLTKFTGQGITLKETDYPIFFVDDIGKESVNFMINYLLTEGFIISNAPVAGLPSKITLTPKGWNRIYELQNKTNKDSIQGFIAMWFNPEMNNASNIIHKAIKECNFIPKRIDTHESNNKICDEIIAEIRKSKFIVCDFTGQRGGVYFEAGFAYGLGLPVIWTCREDWFESEVDKEISTAIIDEGQLKGQTIKVKIKEERKTHFDINHYNFIVWRTEEELYERLLNRINATII